MMNPPLLRKLRACMRAGECIEMHAEINGRLAKEVGYLTDVAIDSTTMRVIEENTGEHDYTLTVPTLNVLAVIEDYELTHKVSFNASLAATVSDDDGDIVFTK